jgi:hypothetical protein
MTFGLEYKVTGQFFDRAPVQKMMVDHERRSLSRIGAFIRRRARSSIRRRKRISAAGQPPSAHSTDKVASIKNILFAYDARRKSVVVGPVLLNQRNIGVTNSGTIPETIEAGGAVMIREKRVGKHWMSQGRRVRPGQPTRRRRAVYKPRPIMGPALKAEQPNIPKIFAGRA